METKYNNITGHQLAMMMEEADSLAFSAFTKTFDYVKWQYSCTNDKGEYETIDQQLTGETKTKYMTYDVEIKMRDYAGEPNDCVMEVKKKISLDNYSNNERKIYMVFYPKINKVFVWNLTEFTEEELDNIYNDNDTWALKTMYNDTEGKKAMYMLPTKKAKEFRYVSFKFFAEVLAIKDERKRLKKQKQ